MPAAIRPGVPMRSTPSTVACLLALCAGLGGCATRGAAAGTGPLHVPSPDWRDQVLYFVMTDRFDDGDPGNNDQGAGEYDPRDGAHWSGGDLRGLGNRLDYIQGLGATAVWITPPVRNLWWDANARYGGYHGYWASDFAQVDPHLGTLADYQRLSRDLHGRGMYLVQDIVLNHTGNFFGYDGPVDPADPARNYVRYSHPGGQDAPSQWPFSRNDPRDPAQRALSAYHWTPPITDYTDPVQEKTWQMSGLDDLDSENPEVRRVLRASYGGWIRDAGVDGFRIDTAFYVPPAAIDDFLHADDARAPGVLAVARATGRERFHVFGEGFAIDKPRDDRQQARIDGLMRAARLPGMLHFPLYGTLGDVFARGRPTADLQYRLERTLALHAQPHLLPTFVDNHDVDRFLAGGDAAGLEQALLAMLTLPGIPTIYYGTEQGFTGQRAAMFADGVDSGGVGHFDTQAPLYRFLREAIALRRGHKVFSRGVPTVLAAKESGPGVLAYRMDGEGATAFVAFNTGASPALLSNLETGLPPGTWLDAWFERRMEHGSPRLAPVVDAAGRVSVVLPPRSAVVWGVGEAMDGVPPTGQLEIEALASEDVRGDFIVRGTAPPRVEDLQLVVDDELRPGSPPISVGADGRWQAIVDTSALSDPGVRHRVVAWSPSLGAASGAREFRVQREWKLLADVADPVGDDRGPRGTYRYPTDPSWGANRQLDLERVRVLGAEGALAIEVGVHRVTTSWNPANDFDHVAFTVFIELPGEPGGATVMPLQDASLPAGMRWHRRLRAHGWSNALTSDTGASATDEGQSVAPAAAISVDAATNTVRFALPARSLGERRSLSGARILVTTWDYDGGFRALTPEGGGHVFGGGQGSDAKVMDESAVIVVP
jgi:glycosidase